MTFVLSLHGYEDYDDMNGRDGAWCIERFGFSAVGSIDCIFGIRESAVFVHCIA